MMPNRQMAQPISQENPLWVSWHDTQSMASLSPQNVMEYFCRKSNPFYDRMCNNETIRMQRSSLDHLNNMTGVEYILLHVAEPILYVIRKQHRHSPTEATPMADYYIIGGSVYKAPDLANVINWRILSTVTNLQSAFEEASNYSRYHPNKGYTWDFTANKALSDKSKAAAKKDATTNKDESGTIFQKQRVDMLLAELLRKFPPPIPPIIHQQQMQQRMEASNGIAAAGGAVAGGSANVGDPNTIAGNNGSMNNPAEASPAAVSSQQFGGGVGGGIEPKVENVDMKPPPEKKMKI